MDNRLKQILGIFNSKESVNTDTFLKVELNGSERLLPPGELNRVLDVALQFDTERQNCPYYRILGKINPTISNVLFNLTGTGSTWETFNTPLFTTTPFNSDKSFYTLNESIKVHLKENNGWWGYIDPNINNARLCNYFDMEPKRERFSFIPDTTNPNPNTINPQVKNWELTITYPYTADTKHPMINGGITMVDKQSVTVGGRIMTGLSVPVHHNLIDGDVVSITGTTNDGEYEVKRVGLDNGDLKKFYFCIDLDPTLIAIGPNSRMVKITNGIPCQYYFRKFKKIKTKSDPVIQTDDYEVYNLGFSENIYSDPIEQFVFNEDVDVSDLTDNLGRPLSELYLTIIKTDSLNIFTNVSSGIEAPFISEFNTANINTYLKNIPVIQKIHNVTSAPSQTFKALELNINVGNSDFYGDVVEYNLTTVQEIVLSDVYYRFSTINRETTGNSVIAGPRPEGYYYKAHNLIKIRDYSSYIEEGDINTVGIPDYATNLGDGRYLWRELLNIGTTNLEEDYVNYPFLNNAQYMYDNYCFDIRRQDPFDNWDLYFSAEPADPIGNTMNNNFKINTSDNVC
jgi:hypothetical protein